MHSLSSQPWRKAASVIAVITTITFVTALSACGGGNGSGRLVDSDTLATTVQTAEGPVTGSVSDGFTLYRGIPYAAPPVGNLRWATPAPAPVRGTTLEAKAFGPACAQTGPGTEANSSEDCLYLNIWRPKGATPDHRLPVLVYMHGGAFVLGSGAMADASAVAQRGIVVVSFNYRLGALGHLASRPIQQANGDASLGNFALMDAVAALKWVQKNIGAFGGDVGNVTMWGLSAGATQTFSLIQSPRAQGLFRRAVLQSGGSGPFSNLSPSTSLATGEAFMERVGCKAAQDVVACMRALPVSRILEAQATGRWRPTVDGVVLTDVPSQAFQTGQFNRVDVMIGGVQDEGTIFADTSVTADGYANYLHTLVPAGFPTADLDAAYPLARYAAPAQGYARAQGDSLYACANSARRDDLSRWVSVYGWEFTDPVMSYPRDAKGFYYGSSHGMDSMYFFGKMEGFLQYPFLDASTLAEVSAPKALSQRKALSSQMLAYLTSYIQTGNPNTRSGGLLEWPLHGGVAERKTMAFTLPATKVTSQEFEREHNCLTVWRNVPGVY